MPNTSENVIEHVLRLIEILQQIPRRRYTSTSALKEQLEEAGFGVSMRTLQRDLELLTAHFPIVCDTRSKPFGYRWMDTAQNLSIPHLSTAEALLLQLAERELRELIPGPTLHRLLPLLSLARQTLEQAPHSQRERQWLERIVRLPDSQPLLPSRIKDDVFDAVSTALYQQLWLDLRYRNARGSSKEARVMPLGLVQQGVRLYLVARFDGYDNQRILALPRISKAIVSEESFTYPTDFDLNAYAHAGEFGISHGRQVRLSFCIDPVIGAHLLESPLSQDQESQQTDQGLVIQATVLETELLHRWLRGWGDALRWMRIEALDAAVTNPEEHLS